LQTKSETSNGYGSFAGSVHKNSLISKEYQNYCIRVDGKLIPSVNTAAATRQHLNSRPLCAKHPFHKPKPSMAAIYSWVSTLKSSGYVVYRVVPNHEASSAYACTRRRHTHTHTIIVHKMTRRNALINRIRKQTSKTLSPIIPNFITSTPRLRARRQWPAPNNSRLFFLRS
jgi:hypothetical protein